MVSRKICVLVLLGLLFIIDESESIKCYDCNHTSDGENCHTATNLREKDCQNYCFTMTGTVLGQRITSRACADDECNKSIPELTNGVCQTCNTNFCNGNNALNLKNNSIL